MTELGIYFSLFTYYISLQVVKQFCKGLYCNKIFRRLKEAMPVKKNRLQTGGEGAPDIVRHRVPHMNSFAGQYAERFNRFFKNGRIRFCGSCFGREGLAVKIPVNTESAEDIGNTGIEIGNQAGPVPLFFQTGENIQALRKEFPALAPLENIIDLLKIGVKIFHHSS